MELQFRPRIRENHGTKEVADAIVRALGSGKRSCKGGQGRAGGGVRGVTTGASGASCIGFLCFEDAASVGREGLRHGKLLHF